MADVHSASRCSPRVQQRDHAHPIIFVSLAPSHPFVHTSELSLITKGNRKLNSCLRTGFVLPWHN